MDIGGGRIVAGEGLRGGATVAPIALDRKRTNVCNYIFPKGLCKVSKSRH
jgi:hypothetical protein